MLLFVMLEDSSHTARKQSGHIDETWIFEIGMGDPEAFASLYRASERTLYAYALSILKNPDDACDIVQETFLRIRASAHLYIPQGKPLAWMFTIVRNLCRNHQRAADKIISAEDTGLEDSIHFSYVTDRVDRIILESALSILDEEEREIVLLHAVSGVRHRELAMNLEMPLSTVLSKYHRALKKLKKYLLEQGVSM